MNNNSLKTIVYKEGEQYIAQCLDVDVASFGNTKKEALDMLIDALRLYFQDAPIPDSKKRVTHVSIESVSLAHA
jgi:predicted RNase H-like HicB family nuclease